MDSHWQTWAALAVVAISAVLLALAWWRRRGSDEGCDCPGSKAGRELRKLKR
jgi:hypothetical protein